jgi:DNA polymerase kappa
MDNTKEKDNFKDDLLLRMGLNDNKAGMEGLDKEKINKIIMEATKVCSSFFQYLGFSF